MIDTAKVIRRVRGRLPELRALSKWPVFVLFLSRAKASIVAMAAHAAFMALLLEPLLKLLLPPPKRSGLAAIFGGGSDPAPHEEVLAWLGPLLWVIAWALFGVFLERSVKPALSRARQRSRDFEAEAQRRLAAGDVLGGLTLLEEAAAVSPDPDDERRLHATLAQVRGTSTSAAPPAAERTTAAAERATAVAPHAADGAEGRATLGNGRITLDALLGEGAMGRVFAATDRLLGRRLAVKELAEGVASNDTYRERFLREAQVLARLSHPNIVQVFDLLGEGHRHYLCMELVEGATLDLELRRRGAFPLREAASLAEQIARALAYAHGRGVVHRDLKPANVLVAADGRVKVVDFGVARLVDQRMTATGMIIGTPVYMAPEQIAGEEVDERGDLYALGVLLYELAAGEAPFEGNLAAIFARKLNDAPPRLRLDPGDPLAAGYAELVDSLLAREREARPARAELVAERLAAISAAPAA